MYKLFKASLLSSGLLASVLSASPAFAVDPAESLSPAKDSAELVSFKKAIRQQYDLKEQAWAAGDYNKLVKGFYATNAFTAMEGAPEEFVVGHSQFLEMYKTFVKDATKVRIESYHTHVNGNMGWDWTNFYADVKPEKAKDYPPSPTRILFLWEKIGGKWVSTGDVVLLGKFSKKDR